MQFSHHEYYQHCVSWVSLTPPPTSSLHSICSLCPLSLFKQGVLLFAMETRLQLTEPNAPYTPLTLHIIYPFPLLFSAYRLVVFYNKIDEGWRMWFCLVLFGKWHTPGSDRETQQGLAQAVCPMKRYRRFEQRGPCPSLMTFSNTQAEYIVLRLNCQTSCWPRGALFSEVLGLHKSKI